MERRVLCPGTMRTARSIPVLIAIVAAGCGDPPRPASDPDAGPGRAEALPAIAGGTLLALAEGGLVAVQPDELVVVGTDPLLVRHRIPVAPGADPGRSVEDARGLVHVVMRGAGTVATIDPRRGEVVDEREVCAAPRGIAWRREDDTLRVACAEGVLVTLAAAGGPVVRRDLLEGDLRDVVSLPTLLVVSRFRSAEILVLSPELGSVFAVHTPVCASPGGAYAARVAWRMVASEERVVVAHQCHSTERVAISGTVTPGTAGSPYAGTTAEGVCAPILWSALSVIDPRSPVAPTPALHVDVPLAVDLALAPSGGQLAIVSAADPARSRVVPTSALAEAPTANGCAVVATVGMELLDRPIAVAWAPGGPIYVQTRPASIHQLSAGGLVTRLVLPAVPSERGHELFHRRTESGLACASCHPEGGDDGHTWALGGADPVRTQTLRGHVMDTAPFHWAGDLPTFEALYREVMIDRMGGGAFAVSDAELLRDYLHRLEAPPRPRRDPDAIARGRALFESSELGCSSCHAGLAGTNGGSADVGTDGTFQVPMLVGVAYRAPYMHDGCARTLRERFTDPICGGGDRHGRTSHLLPHQIDDLIAYVEQL